MRELQESLTISHKQTERLQEAAKRKGLKINLGLQQFTFLKITLGWREHLGKACTDNYNIIMTVSLLS